MENFQKLQHLLAAEDTEPLVLVSSLVVGTAGVGVILMGLGKLFALLFACLLDRGRKIPDWACPRRASTVPFPPPGLAPDIETVLAAQRDQLVVICDGLRTSLEQKMDMIMEKLHAEFGKLHGEFENLNERLDTVSDRVQGISARVQGLMSELARIYDLVQDGQAILVEVQGHTFETKTSLAALCADTQNLLSGLTEFNTAVANSFQDMFVVQQDHTKRFDSWHQNLQQLREKVQQVLERISDRCEAQSMQTTISQSLMSDARLHAINTSLIAVLNHLGVNPKMVPATLTKPQEPSPTPQKQPPTTQTGSSAPGLKANMAAARTGTQGQHGCCTSDCWFWFFEQAGQGKAGRSLQAYQA